MALEDGGTRFPSSVLMIPDRQFAQVAVIDPGIAVEAFEPWEMGENFSRALGNLGLADFVFRHGCRHRRDLNVKFDFLVLGLPALARGFKHVNPRAFDCLEIKGPWIRRAVIGPSGRVLSPRRQYRLTL